jgi:ketol-acid reductoisomerase
MANMYTGDDMAGRGDLLRDRLIAVVGYGNQGRSQALNLRDRGYAVVVGNRDDGYAEQARADGFDVRPIADAIAEADVVALLLPDEVQPAWEATLSAMTRGQTLVFASGYNITYGRFKPSPDIDVVLGAPRMIGASVRSNVQQGRGFPMLIGVAQDVTGQAADLALAYCHAVGALLPGGVAVESSFREETLLDLFSEQTWAGAFLFLVEACFTVLMRHQISPEAALLELYASGEVGEIGHAMAERGLWEQLRLHSTTSQYGQLTRGPRFVTPELTARLEEALAGLEDGSFAREWAKAEGTGALTSLLEARRQTPLQAAEDRLYARLGRRGGKD